MRTPLFCGSIPLMICESESLQFFIRAFGRMGESDSARAAGRSRARGGVRAAGETAEAEKGGAAL